MSPTKPLLLFALLLGASGAYLSHTPYSPPRLGSATPPGDAAQCRLREILSAREVRVACGDHATSVKLHCVGETFAGGRDHLESIISQDLLLERRENGAAVLWSADEPRSEDLNLALISGGSAKLSSDCLDATYLTARRLASRPDH